MRARTVDGDLAEGAVVELTKAQQKLIAEHMDFADSGALKYFARCGGRVDLDTLKSAAYAGLCVAASRFEPARGFTFKTYAMHWTERFLRREFQTNRRANGWAWSPNREEQADGRKGMQRLAFVDQWPMQPDSDEPVEFVAEPEALDERIERAQKRRIVLESCDTERERIVLRGLLNGEPYTVIGARVGLSRGWVWLTIQKLLPKVTERARQRLSYSDGSQRGQ